MSTPTARLLELLELLQSTPAATGREISDRLGIDRRTVRRDIDALRGLGIPVEGQRGVGGGYAMRPGFRLPPLMLRDDEAVAVALGVVAAGRLGLAGSPESAATALEKVHRALPEQLRRRVQSLESTLDFTAAAAAAVPVPADTALVLAEAIRRRRRVRTSYRSFAGERTRRELSPHGLVVHSGRWYLAAHDHLREELRTFRVDRMRRVTAVDAAGEPAPAGFDAVAHVSTSLARVPWPWQVEVLLDLPLDQAARRLPGTLAELVDADGGTLLRMRVSSLDWMATVLARLDCPFTIRTPQELRTSVRALAERLSAWA
ncbi:MAG TPA: YafY family protein [Gaiellales bacterium]|jgi:predicted DNA-binding transcriptional regulator YafY